jgi:cytochrome c oxidase subunit 3
MAQHDHDFHIPGNSLWSPLSCIGVGLLAFGLIAYLHAVSFGIPLIIGQLMMLNGLALTTYGAAKWFFELIKESRERGFKEKVAVLDIANRYGMVFFIVSEIMFFAAFFVAYFYLRGHAMVWPPENIYPSTSNIWRNHYDCPPCDCR